MELSHASYEGDKRQDDDQDGDNKRRNRIGHATKKAVSGWFGTSEATSTTPSDSEQRMPVSIVAPEGSESPSRTIPHESALRSTVLLAGDVEPVQSHDRQEPPSAVNVTEAGPTRPAAEQLAQPLSDTEEAAFQRLLQQAGLDELAHSFEKPQEAPTSDAAAEKPTETDQREHAPRHQARTRALIAFAAGLMIGSHAGRRKVRQELRKTLEEIEENMVAAGIPRTPGEDPFKLEPEEHVVQDAWHSIVIDKHGHEDVNARYQYGQAFKQEQREVQQSALSDTTSPATAQAFSDQPQVQPPVVATNPAPPMLTGPVPAPRLTAPTPRIPSLPDGITEPQLPPGSPLREDPQHLLPAHAKQSVSLLVNPWVWLIAGLLILVFFAASLIG